MAAAADGATDGDASVDVAASARFAMSKGLASGSSTEGAGTKAASGVEPAPGASPGRSGDVATGLDAASPKVAIVVWTARAVVVDDPASAVAGAVLLRATIDGGASGRTSTTRCALASGDDDRNGEAPTSAPADPPGGSTFPPRSMKASGIDGDAPVLSPTGPDRAGASGVRAPGGPSTLARSKRAVDGLPDDDDTERVTANGAASETEVLEIGWTSVPDGIAIDGVDVSAAGDEVRSSRPVSRSVGGACGVVVAVPRVATMRASTAAWNSGIASRDGAIMDTGDAASARNRAAPSTVDRRRPVVSCRTDGDAGSARTTRGTIIGAAVASDDNVASGPDRSVDSDSARAVAIVVRGVPRAICRASGGAASGRWPRGVAATGPTSTSRSIAEAAGPTDAGSSAAAIVVRANTGNPVASRDRPTMAPRCIGRRRSGMPPISGAVVAARVRSSSAPVNRRWRPAT